MKRKLNRFLGFKKKLEFGNYILFQEYKYDNKNNIYNISKPILAIYLGCFVADQTLGFNYVKWNNEKHTVYITNDHVTNYPVVKEVKEIGFHIEWDDYIDILGTWNNRPKWKKIISKYRKENTERSISGGDVDVS